MRILRTNQNIFDIADQPNTGVCVTTNGVRKRDGSAVMGAGQALEANQRYACSGKLGQNLAQFGNSVCDLGIVQTCSGYPYRLIAFPTKHHWKDKSDMDLIIQSTHQLLNLTNKLHLSQVYLPPVGCGLGCLNWDKQVAPVLESLLDDRFYVLFRTVRG